MSGIIQKINDINKTLNESQFKSSEIFTNSLLKTTDTTQLIRDIRDEEVVFFQNKKMSEIDYEIINSLGDQNNDFFAQHEFCKLLEDDDTTDTILDQQLAELIPYDFDDDDVYNADILNLKNIYKRSYKINKLCVSADSNMLDQETTQVLLGLKTQLDETFSVLKEIAEYQTLIKSQKEQLNSLLNVTES